jgi:hypothetical protein
MASDCIPSCPFRDVDKGREDISDAVSLSRLVFLLESAEPLPVVVRPGGGAFCDLACVFRTLCRRRWTGLGCEAWTPGDANIAGTVMRCARMQASSGSCFRGRPFRNYD